MGLTVLLVIFYVILIFWGKKKNEDIFFMSREYTTAIKGICCISVILVHIPRQYSNVLIDIISSFAYISVTLFFLFSAYGLESSFEYNKANWWGGAYNRVVKLLVPYLIVYIIKKSFGFSTTSGGTRFVFQLLLLNLLYYVVYKFKNKYSDMILSCSIFFISIFGHLTQIGIGWYPETVGFFYGIIIFRFRQDMIDYKKKYYDKKLFLLLAISIILGISYLKMKNIFFGGDYILKITLGASIIMLFLLFSTRVKIYNLLSNWIGKISYEIFLIHGFVIEFLETFLPDLKSDIFLLITLIGTLIFAVNLNFLHRILLERVFRMNSAKAKN